MPMDPEVSRVMDDVLLHRSAVQQIQAAITETLEQTAGLDGVGGMWSKLTGSYEAERKAGAAQVAALRKKLATTQVALTEAEARLVTARTAADAREAEAGSPAVTGSPTPPPDATLAYLARPPTGELADRIEGMEKLESVLHKLRELGPQLQMEGRLATKRNNRLGLGRRNRSFLGEVIEGIRSTHIDVTLSRVRESWDSQVILAEQLATRLEVELHLPRSTGHSSKSDRLHQRNDASGVRYGGLTDFADQLQYALAELDGLVTLLQSGRAELRKRHVENAPAPTGGKLGELVRSWENLFAAAKALDQACVPGVKTSALLGLMGAWNREAALATELAGELNLPVVPPVNQGGDLIGFIAELRSEIPALRAEVAVLQAQLDSPSED